MIPLTSVAASGNPLPKVEKLGGHSHACPKGKRQVRRHGKARCVKKRGRPGHTGSHRRRAYR